MTNVDYFLYSMIFVVGVVVGRISMAIQYAMMKKAARRKS